MKAVVKLTGMNPFVVDNLTSVKRLCASRMMEVKPEDFMIADNMPYLFIGDRTFAVNGSKLDCVTFE